MKKLFVLLLVVVSALVMQAQEMSRPLLETGRVAEALELYKAGDVAGAVDLLLDEIEANRKNGYAHFHLGYIFQYADGDKLGLEQSEVESVKAPLSILICYDNAFEYIPKKDKYYRALCKVYQAFVFRGEELYDSSNSALDMAFKLYDNPVFISEKGQNYILKGEYNMAIQAFESSNSIGETTANYMGLAISYINLEQYDDAIRMIEKVLERNDDQYSYALAQLARVYVGKGEYENAVAPALDSYLFDAGDLAWNMLTFLLDETPELVVAKAKIALVKNQDDKTKVLQLKDLVARAYYKLDDYRNVLKYAIEVHEEVPDYYYICALLMSSHAELGEYDKALVYVDRMIAIDTMNSEAYKFKANLYYSMANLDKALETINYAISLDPEVASYYGIRGKLNHYMGRLDDAIEDYMMAVTLDPEDSYSYIQRGVLLKKQGKNVLAEQDFRKAIEVDSVNNECLAMSFGYCLLGNKEKAIETFVECYDAKMIDDYNAACLFALMDEKNMALRYLERSLDLGYRDFAHIQFDTDLDNIREMPEFKALIEKYKNLK